MENLSIYEFKNDEKEILSQKFDLTEPINNDTYIVNMINLSSVWTVIAFSTDYVNWVNISPIGKTCDGNYDLPNVNRCANEGRFLPMFTTQCGQNLNVWIRLRNFNGQIATLKKDDPFRFYADCRNSGIVLNTGFM